MTVKASAVRGGGYDDFWAWRGRYRVCKGSRASKKSKTTALWFIWNIMKHPQANALVVRRTFRTLRNSCFSDLKWAMARLGVERFWDCTVAPLEMTYRPTGQKILFRGLDDPLKITSISVDKGILCWGWIEEAYEIRREEDFQILDESLRGNLPDGLFYQWTLTFNPWNQIHWLKLRFFDTESHDTLAITTDYTINEFIDNETRAMFEKMRVTQPTRYRVAGLGEWGMTQGVVYENVRIWGAGDPSFDQLRRRGDCVACFGLDFGYTNSQTALFCGIADPKNQTMYVFDEIYARGMSNEEIARQVTAKGYAKERIIADSAEPKSIDRLRELGLFGVVGADKGGNAKRAGIDFLRDWAFVVAESCVHFRDEIESYAWATDKQGNMTNEPAKENDHLMDAMRYACEPLISTAQGAGSFADAILFQGERGDWYS